MMDSVKSGKFGGTIQRTISHTWVCIANCSCWVPSHYLTKEYMDSIAIDIVDRDWVKHSEKGKLWVKHSHSSKPGRRRGKRKRHLRRAMANPAAGEEVQWEKLFNKETPAHIRQSITVMEEEIFGEFKMRLGEGVVMSHY